MFMCDVTKTHLTRVILLTVNYCSFANGDVSIRFNGKDDNVVLEYQILGKFMILCCFFLFVYPPPLRISNLNEVPP